MDTTAISTKLTAAALVPALGTESLQVLFQLRWAVACIVVLVIADFWFGISASLTRGERFRLSRAGRRTMNKLIDYICYLLIGTVIGLGILEPLGIATHTQTAAVCIGLAALFEIDSVSDHVCELHGIRKRFSVKRFLIHLLKRKRPAVGEALEKAIKDKTDPKSSS